LKTPPCEDLPDLRLSIFGSPASREKRGAEGE
jgi:hypothetical protein